MSDISTDSGIAIKPIYRAELSEEFKTDMEAE